MNLLLAPCLPRHSPAAIKTTAGPFTRYWLARP